MVLTLCALCVFSQNLRINFYAQIDENKKVAPDSVLVENLASGYSKMIHKELSDDKSITIIGKWLDKPNTIGDELAEQDFLCQKTKATVAVSMNRSAKLHLALYNISGTKITDYVNDFGVGQYEFSVTAPIGIYVLTANDGVRSSSLKLSIEGHNNVRIEEIAVEKTSNYILKSYYDTVTFYNIEDLRFTGYYNGLSDVQFFDIASFLLSEEIVFTFPFVKGEVKDITGTTAVLVGNTCNLKENTIIEKGFYFGTSYNPIEEGTKYIVETEDFLYMVENLQGSSYYRYCPYFVTEECTIYGEVLSFKTNSTQVHVPISGIGGLNGVFSTSETTQVFFSQGNLQYQASTDTWRFAENQYDAIGSGNVNIASDYSGWIDLFGWGTSGYNDKKPYMTTLYNNEYGDGTNDIAGTNYDWGEFNIISNGGFTTGLWRTLTGKEWEYILSKRENAELLKGFARIDNTLGFVLLPDNWELPNGITFSSESKIADGGETYETINTYTRMEWQKMELNGAVFLPVTGIRDGTSLTQVPTHGYYVSSSANGFYIEGGFFFGNQYCSYEVSEYNKGYRYKGQAVRLVQDVSLYN